MTDNTVIISSTGNTVEKKAHLGDGRISEAVAPPGCAFIDDWAFAHCARLKEIWIPEGCRVSEKAFSGSEALERIFIYRDDSMPEKKEYLNLSPELLALAVKTWQRDTAKLFEIACDKESFLKWYDEKLFEYLNEDDANGFRPFQAGGEEDYGDEAGEKLEYIRKVKLNKLRMITQRLMLCEDGGYSGYIDHINRSDPALFFSLFKSSDLNAAAFKKLYQKYDLYNGIEKEDLLICAGDDVEIRAVILQRDDETGSPGLFFSGLQI